MIKTPKKRELVLPVPPQRVDVVIGIDPDAEKNGVAMLQRADREIEAMALNFRDALNSAARVILSAVTTRPDGRSQKCASIGRSPTS